MSNHIEIQHGFDEWYRSKRGFLLWQQEAGRSLHLLKNCYGFMGVQLSVSDRKLDLLSLAHVNQSVHMQYDGDGLFSGDIICHSNELALLPGSVDLLVCFHVSDVLNQLSFLHSISSLLAPGGRLFVFVYRPGGYLNLAGKLPQPRLVNGLFSVWKTIDGLQSCGLQLQHHLKVGDGQESITHFGPQNMTGRLMSSVKPASVSVLDFYKPSQVLIRPRFHTGKINIPGAVKT